ncbi:MAG TPA: lysylphosphatidylglycerol synthase domain-containing protein [Candidatus Acidoferrum sp.]|jgi:uncharacterized membrane protein YbhN (UPF0104 family)|nr:lysylphosphatidylglycerol synthase domain-containing protein [Candidatus Acidoferrum sp.]
MKKFNIILLFAGLLFLGGLIIHLGAGELWQELRLLGWGLFLFILGEGIAEMIHTVGWRYCLAPPYRSLSWWRLYQIRMVGYAINYLTPTAALGGEAAKINLLAAYHRGPKAASGVLIEKFCFPFAQVLFVLMGSLFLLGRVHLPKPLWISMFLSISVVAGGMLGFFLLQKYGKLGCLIRWLAARRPDNATLKKLAEQTSHVDSALRDFYARQSQDLWLAIGWHLLGYCIGFFQTWLFLHLVGQGTSLPIIAAIWFLGMWFDLLTFAVPLNMGSLEGSRIIVFKAVGYAALPGMAYGLAIRFSQIFWSIVGLVIYGYLTALEKNNVARSILKNTSYVEIMR